MNYKDITVGIVSFKSEKVIFDCLKSIKSIKEIIIFDNSYDIETKKKVANIYPNIKFILSKKNLGYGEANNKIIKSCKTEYLFILNPDTILQPNCEMQLLKSINELKLNFSIIAPISNKKDFGNFDNSKVIFTKKLIKVDFVKGYAMLLNVKKIKKLGMFDKNIFLYLEEIDLCKRIKERNQKIFVNKEAKIIHLEAKSTDLKFEFEKCRNWHWMWSKIYFNKKYSNKIIVTLKFLPKLLLIFLKLIFYLLMINKNKTIIYYYRMSGMFNGLIGKTSWFRPRFEDI